MKDSNKNLLTLDSRTGGGIFTFAMLLFVIVSLLLGFVLALLCSQDSVEYKSVSALFSVGSLIVVVITVSKKSQTPFLETTNLKKFNPVYVLVSVVLAFAMLFGFGFINIVIADFLKENNLNTGAIEIPLYNVWYYLLFTFIVAVLPAIIEEMFFRGLLVKTLDGQKTAGVIIVVALCFAFYHCSLTQLVYQLIYGAAFTALTIKAKSIVPAIISHFINNFAILSFEFFGIFIDYYSLVIIAIGIALFLLFVLFMIFYKKQSDKDKQKGIIQFFFPYGVFGFALCIAIIVLGVFSV